MTLQKFLISRGSITLGLALSRLPRSIGYPLAAWLADRVSSRKQYPPVKATRANQWIVHNRQPSSAELDQIVRRTYRNTGRSLYEFWHFMRNRKAVSEMVHFEPSFHQTISSARQANHGLILVVAHLANFDLIGHATALNGTALHVLSYPQPPGGYQWQNKIRALPNLKITPISVESMRSASETLKNKGIVATGIDRPLSEGTSKYPVNFFGQPSFLPVLHIRLAIKHDIPIAVIGGCRDENGTYAVWSSPPVVMEKRADLVEETVINAEKILNIMEGNIRRVPEQWAMFYPVWPKAINNAPS